ncbi:hypothetical protein BC826DRAFT_1106026 [Russula brevipes]|nr:hypothetical protein BC826DRAFT_1106026 [Russula brevipes]
MPRNIIHSDVSVDPESESEALSIAPDVEEEPEVELEEEEEEAEPEDEEGEEADEPEEEEEDEEPADDGDGDAVREVRIGLDELSSPSASPAPVQTTPSRSSRLKITLKLPTQPQKPPRVRRAVHKDKDLDSGIESEDDDDEQPRDGKRPLTTRQAVLASVVGSSHVSLDETSRKKKQLNEAEIALRREETARKRKHLSEKKLEDEKAETINRLLKKKSGTRNRRNPLASAEDRTPATHTGNGTPAEGEVDEEESGETAVAPVVPVVEVVPTRYRWISTLRPSPDAPPGDKMLLSFSVPTSLLPASHQPALDADGDTNMEEQEQRSKPPAPPAVCDVEGCTANRKYRLVRDWERGACGMDHLHLLERQPGAVMVNCAGVWVELLRVVV